MNFNLYTRLLISTIFFCNMLFCEANTDLASLKKIVKKKDAVLKTITTDSFFLQSVEQIKNRSDILRVYIEGDGLGYIHNLPAKNPSPKKLTLLKLMFLDPYPDKLYLARPCQFIQGKQCHPDIWTKKRYGKAVFTALNDALTHIKSQGSWTAFELIGYSGGAVFALLLAANRSDIQSVRTIAGNILPNFTDQLHHLVPSSFSLNPLKQKDKLISIPQWHFIGAQDRLITPAIIKKYLSQLSNTRCIQYAV
ncbi:MAG: hypothetical protein HAW67_00295, partial [Endozoicomonadaceae bacterium]|nr:hypothetical protein [Endozoicomonadaceae bacterium]